MNIKIVRNLLDKQTHKAVWEHAHLHDWSYGQKSKASDRQQFFIKYFPKEDVTIQKLWSRIQKKLNLKACTVSRAYANGQVACQDGGIHFDDNREDTLTALYYPNPIWKPEWNGETVFYTSKGEIEKAISYYPNQLVVFDSTLLHSSRAPSILFPDIRVTIAFKLVDVQK